MAGAAEEAAVKSKTATLFSFPNPVNEVAARAVAAGVLVLALVTLLADLPGLLLVITYGFWARAATGPSLSPLGQLATRVVAPRLASRARLVPGPPKRFAQAIGAGVTTLATVCWLSGEWRISQGLLVLMIVFASLESILAICVGCRVFSLLMRVGLIPEAVCQECADLSQRVTAPPRREPAALP
jgi:hypothetical protein